MRKRLFSGIVFLMMFFLSSYAFALEIHEAVKNGDVAKVRTILDNDPSMLTAKDDIGKTPLHWAAGKNQLEVMKVLLDEYNINVNIRNANNGTPLHVAASQANPEAALILIEHGADVNARTLNNSVPLHFAVIKSGRKPGHTQAVKILIENGADVNVATEDGATPLNMAMFRRNQEMINYLKSKGAKPGNPSRRRGGMGRGGRSTENPYLRNYLQDR